MMESYITRGRTKGCTNRSSKEGEKSAQWDNATKKHRLKSNFQTQERHCCEDLSKGFLTARLCVVLSENLGQRFS